MELRQLRYAVRLAEVRHFGRAAELERIAPSVLSAQIKQLETELGVTLFDRSSRHFEVTPAGNHFVDEARDVLGQLDALRTESLAIERRENPKLRVGFFGEAFGLLDVLLQAFVDAHPEVDVSFVQVTMASMTESLVSGEVDLSLLHLPIDDVRLTVIPLVSGSRHAAVSARDPRADAPHLTMADLFDAPFVVAADGAPHGWSSFWSLDDARGESSRVGAVVNTAAESVLAVAYANAVDTFPSSFIAAYAHPGVRFVPILDAPPSEIGIVHRADTKNAAVSVFRDLALEVARAYPGSVWRQAFT